MKSGFKLLILSVTLLLTSCIKDDFLDDAVDERLSIDNPLSEIQTGDTYTVMATFFNNVGEAETIPLTWSSSDTEVATISNNGLLTAISQGTSTISVQTTLTNGNTISDQFSVSVVEGEVVIPELITRSGTINTTSSYVLTGDFTISEIEDSEDLDLQIMSNYEASSSLPGLYLYLSNNPNSVASALEIGPVSVFNGAHDYLIDETGINEYQYLVYWCKPFSVKVGHGEILE